jgi:hypothetical protein
MTNTPSAQSAEIIRRLNSAHVQKSIIRYKNTKILVRIQKTTLINLSLHSTTLSYAERKCTQK